MACLRSSFDARASGGFLGARHVQHVHRRRPGALRIGALGIMPYISATIIIQLLTAVVPQLSKLAREEGGGPRSSSTAVI
jgi:hypothetical protein